MSFFIGLMSLLLTLNRFCTFATLNSQMPAGVSVSILVVSVNQKVQITIQLNVIFNAKG